MIDKDYTIPEKSLLAEIIIKKASRLRILFKCSEKMKKKNSDKAISGKELPYPPEMMDVINKWIQDLENEIIIAIETDIVGYVFEND
jgi:hypothetical protein